MKGARFLVVEDDDDHAELISLALRGVTSISNIDRARDGEEALAYLQQHRDAAPGTQPHIVLLDLKLPKIDGIEVLTRIKNDQALKTIPVVILTTSRADMDKIRAYENNANSYLVKPMDFDGFEDVLKQLGHYWSACNQPAPSSSTAREIRQSQAHQDEAAIR